ncbi:hypothetical protein TrCOL_g8125 [Triparma columacea]|nr:hypothetical protein TrCOL_g8125 [Triparma columacea]
MDDDLSRLSIDDFDDEMSVASSAASYTSDSVPLPSPLKSVPPPLPNQRVIKADAERTRGDPKTIERLLTHYCISNDIKYKQGLNELLAPFLTLTYSPACNDPELVAFGCFTAFTKKFLPTNVYADDGHTALQCCFRFFRVLLLYHSPNVCKLLDGHRLPPELYASGWFLTLFAQRLEMTDLYSFWDLYLLYDEPVLHHFVCLRLLMRGESTIAAASEATLPIILQQLSASVEEINPVTLFKEARLVADATPRSFVSLLERACWGWGWGINEKVKRFEKQSLTLVLKCVGSWSCVPISADEAIGFALKNWGITSEKNSKGSPARSRQRSKSGNTIGPSLANAEATVDEPEPIKQQVEQSELQQEQPLPQNTPFASLPSYLTSPDSVRSVSSLPDDSDLESMYSDGDVTDVESSRDGTGFSDDEGDGGEENDVAPTSPSKTISAASPSTPMTPRTASHSANIQQRKHSKRKYVLLDCRPKNEYDECHIYGSVHLDEECWSTGEVTSVIEGFKDMRDCHFALLGSGPSSFDLQMSVNAHKCGPSKGWKRKQRLKNQASNVTQASSNFFKKMVEVTAETLKLKKDEEDKFVPRRSYGDDELDPESMQVGGTGEEDLAVSRWVCMFLQHDFQYISYVRGGIKACIKQLKKAGKPDGVGLAEGAELVLEGTAIELDDGIDEVSHTEVITGSGRRVWKEMVESMSVAAGGAVEEQEDGAGGSSDTADAVDAQSSPNSRNKISKQRKSLEGAKQGWSNFMKQSAAGVAKFTTQRRVSKDTMAVGGTGDDSSSPPPSNDSPKSEANRSNELKELRGELETQLNAETSSPTRNTPQWMKRLSLKTAEAGTKFLLASQKVGENIKSSVQKASPRNSLSGDEDLRRGGGSYYLHKLVDISDFIMSETEIGQSAVQTFSATRCPTRTGVPTSVMLACQILVSPKYFVVLEMKISTPGAGTVVEVRKVGSLSKITTKANEHGLVNFHFKEGEEGEGGGGEAILCFIVEDFRDCIQLMKGNFKMWKNLKEERGGGLKAESEI